MPMITAAVRLSEEETKKLRHLKSQTGQCMSALIRKAVCFYLEEKDGIEAKQKDDWLFSEYEEPTKEVQQ